MNQVRIIGEIEGFDRILYETTVHWGNFSLSAVHQGKATFEAWADGIERIENTSTAITTLIEQVERFILSVEWSYGHELKYTVKNILAPAFASEEILLEISENLRLKDDAIIKVAPREIPQTIPQIPLEAKRWIHIWVESTKLSDYVEEQLRRQYLIIEELWQELDHTFDPIQRLEKKNIKLIRHFVSHASCNDPEVVALVENDLPSALEMVNGKKQVRFKRTVEHRNYIARF